jgi:hypothetical protein
VPEERPHQVDPRARAVAACRQSLVDYQSGLLDEEQLRRALYRDGLLLGSGEAWLLDVAGGTWRRYDGISTERITGHSLGDAVPPRAFDAATLRRWQQGLDGLQAAAPLTGVVGG